MAVVMFDIDGVLADFIGGFTNLAKSYFPNAEVRTTHEQEKWDEFKGLTEREVEATWWYILHNHTFWETLSTLEPEIFYRLAYLKQHDIYFATNRMGKDAKGQTERWISARGYSVSVVLTPFKGELARAIKADYAIDDKAGNAVAISYISPQTTTFILDRKYNQFDQTVVGTRIQRVNSVKEFLNYIERKEVR